MGFGTSSSWLYIVSHAALSGTSLIFYIPSARSITSPMIWPEFRAHSIIFAYRSLVAMSLTELTISDPITRFVTVLGTLLLADGATKYFKMEGVTTMRDMPFPDWVSQTARTQLNYYYSFSQIFATMTILFSSSMERAFMILFPIQIAAFLMTLVRKKIITPLQWHIYYALSLFMNYLYTLLLLNITHTEIMPVLFYISSVFFCFLRFGFRVNKYILWIGIGAIYIFSEYQKEKIELFFLE